ncbi:MAG TPA: polysaccharide biosynthesis tyrosine autokinase, partial [candidate division WOR-3 bacterium]|nr:polysaccharide biosynthesis tyrosine autokinase [candidate division WOR-3 bacterium]
MNQEPGTDTDSGSVSLRQYLDLLQRRVWLLTAVFAALLIGSFAWLASRPAVYQSSTSFLARDDGRGGMRVELFGDGRSGLSRGPNLANHIELLRSRTLAQLVLDSAGPGLRARFEAANLGVAERLRRAIAVRPVRDADVVRLAVRAPDPELAREIAAGYVRAYGDFTLSSSRADVSAVREFVQGQLAVVAARLDTAERRLEEYKHTEGVTDLGQETRVLVERQSRTLARHEQAQARRFELEREAGWLRDEVAAAGVAPAALLDSSVRPALTRLEGEVSELEAERTGLLRQGYEENSPRVRALAERSAAARAEFGRELARVGLTPGPGRVGEAVERLAVVNAELAAAREAERVLAGHVADAERELAGLPGRERVLAGLEREVEVNRLVFSLLAQRHEEARIQEAGRTAAIALVDPPSPGVKVKPDLRSSALVALLLAAFLAFGAAVAVDRLDTRCRRPEDLERTRFPVLASVPRLSLGSGPERPARPELITLNTPGDNDAEAFRILRTNLQFAAAGRSIRTLAVTSSGPSEGKSLIAANLALVMAQSGKRTLLVDADLRRPRQHKLFGGRRKPGLTDVVMLGMPMEQAARPGPVAGLELLSAGTTPPSPVDFLNAEAFGRLAERLAKDYEVVIYDTPPVLVSADAAVLAVRLDGVALVARMGATDLRALAEARRVLDLAGASIFGV